MIKLLHNQLRLGLKALAVCTFVLVGAANLAQAQAPYCIPVYNTGTSSGDYIGRVTLGNINSITGGAPAPYYTYDTASTSLMAGTTHNLILSPGTFATLNNLAAWIDYNQNNIFELTEMLGLVVISAPFPAADTISFTVPVTAMSGTTRMRVREWFSSPGFPGPCGTSDFGETEDYNIHIVAATPCTGVPSAGTLPATISGCGQTSVTITPAGGTIAGNITYQWLHSLDGGITFVAIPGATDPTYTVPLNNMPWGNFFQLQVTCTNSSEIAFSNVTQVTSPTPSPVASNNGPVCPGQTLLLSATGNPTWSYSWTGPNGFTSNQQNPSIANVTWAQLGNYQVVVMNNGCASLPATTFVSVGQGQGQLMIASNQPVCPGNTVTLTATGATSGSYTWTGPNGFTGFANSVSIPNLQPVHYGSYTVTSGTGACANMATISVGSPVGPVVSTNSPVCPGSAIQFFADSTITTQGYSWTGPNGFTSSLPNPVIANADSSHTGLYTVYALLNGCISAPSVIQVNVNAVLLLTATNNGPLNQGGTLILTGSGSNGTYSWTGPNGYATTGHNPYIQYAGPAHAGDYTVSLESPGCATVTAVTNAVVNPMNQISGLVYDDANNNGIQDTGEGGIPGILVTMASSITTTNSQGMYTMYVHDSTYTVSVAGLASYQNANPGTISVTVAGGNQVSTGHNFGIHTTAVIDVEVTITEVWTAAPGFTTYHRIRYKNLGTTPVSGTVRYLPDPLLVVNSSTSAGYTLAGDTLVWSYSNLQPYQTHYKYVYMTVPVGTALGSVLTSSAYITPLAGDIDSTNNTFTLTQTVTGSWDPNDKAVQPAGPITVQDIAAGQDLVYTIRFQNTGTAPAVNVLLVDTLSTNLDLSTFQMLSSSHNYVLTIRENGILEWRFNNIMLPDSNSNEPASHGDVQYRIKPKSSLIVGDNIFNTAHIFFDFNEAVVTNTTHTPVGITATENFFEASKLQLYPNPSSGFVTVLLQDNTPGHVQVHIFNNLGMQVHSSGGYSFSGNYTQQINLAAMPTGMYFVKVLKNGRSYTQKLVRN